MSAHKLLVANRSEIACRIFQSCREMGIRTVGIFAPGDEPARHLTYADEVHPVRSYLDIESVLEVARKAGASLIHVPTTAKFCGTSMWKMPVKRFDG